MKRSCKHIDLTDWRTIRPWVCDCILRHKKRYDFRKLLLRHGCSREDYERAIQTHDSFLLFPAIDSVAREAAQWIYEGAFDLPPVRIHQKEDHCTGKVRMIGCESAMQQALDFIAVGASQEIFHRRIVAHQASSMVARGQLYGVRFIQSWVEQDNRSRKWAERHRVHYASRVKYYVKLDIRKCFPSAKLERFLRLFSRDCGNADLLWLWERLLASHQIAGCTGFMIGSLVSQWAVQYMLSFAYRHMMEQHKERRGKRVPLVTHGVFFMDDMLFTAANRSSIRRACQELQTYAQEELGFTIKPTWHIQRLTESGMDMMGYVVHRSGKTVLRGKSFIRARRMALRYQRQRGRLSLRQARRITSYKGYFRYTDTQDACQALGLPQAFTHAQRLISAKEKRTHAKSIL